MINDVRPLCIGKASYSMCKHEPEKNLEEFQHDVPAIVRDLVGVSKKSRCFHEPGERIMPNLESAREIIAVLREILFFGHLSRQDITKDTVDARLNELIARAGELLAEQIARSFRHDCQKAHKPCDQCRGRAERQASVFLHELPKLRALLNDDVQAAFDGDPAAKGYDEIVFSYPGFLAITVHRIAHQLLRQGVPLLPRILSELSHSATESTSTPAHRSDGRSLSTTARAW